MLQKPKFIIVGILVTEFVSQCNYLELTSSSLQLSRQVGVVREVSKYSENGERSTNGHRRRRRLEY